MPLPFFSRWLASGSRDPSRPSGPLVAESCAPPPFGGDRPWSSRLGTWLGASAWGTSAVDRRPPLGRRGRSDALAAARLEFADALLDVHTAGSVDALDRIAVARSLHELWHFRAEVFSRVARAHDQAEAARRLAALDRHFSDRPRRAANAAAAPTRDGAPAQRR